MAEQADAAAILRWMRDEMLTGPERWTKRAYAACWCLSGALIYSAWDAATPVWCTAATSLRCAVGEYGYRSIDRFNDAPDTTLADVRAVLDRAIALAAGEGGGAYADNT